MPAVDRTSTHTFISLVSFLKELIRFNRSRARDGEAPSASRDPSKVDLGDLAVAQLVHDLRNQLTLIVSYADDLADLVPAGSSNAELLQLRRCAVRASVLTREILLAARPKSVARRPLDLNHVVAPAAEMMCRVAADGIQIKRHVSPVPVLVFAEFIELERIVTNLVLNSFDAIDGEGVVTIETEAVQSPSPSRVEGMQEAPYARLTVTDTGRGVSPEVRARMFEPYFTTKEAGTGLGLSSVAFTVRQLKGAVTVDSEAGRGTSITVILPLCS
jgi:two-component system, cell cycle sensor histidine kinase and response regulator CckA